MSHNGAQGYVTLAGVRVLSDAYGVRTLRAYNVFFGDTYAELQCQYMTAERTAGISACNEMLRTLTVIPSG